MEQSRACGRPPAPIGGPALRWIVLPKIAFWLVLIGILALAAPNPAWPEWLARMAIATGIALGITVLGVRLWDLRKARQRGSGGPGRSPD